MKPTDIAAPDYFHKVVDCQWACPAHTPVPEYIRMIAAGRHSDAYMVNWNSNVFPGILGRTCDRPCEPACRRGRVEEQNQTKPEPVAICRLKRVAADNKGDIRSLLPKAPSRRNGKRVACIGAGPASLTVARDLAPLGYEVVVFDQDPNAGGMIRTQIPRFRLPEDVIDEEVGYVLNIGVAFRGGVRINRRVKIDSGVHIGNSHQHANPIRSAFAEFDLIEIARCVVVDGGPRKIPQVLNRSAWRGGGPGRNGRQLRVGFVREFGVETLGSHFMARGGG